MRIILTAVAGAICSPVLAESKSLPPPQAARAIEERYQSHVKPLLTRYCGDCHFDGVTKGDLDLGQFASLQSIQSQRVTWQKVSDNLITNAMPPPDKKSAPQPSEAERREIAAWVREALAFCDCSGPRDPGRVTIRRLNRTEYVNTVRDLLGVRDFKPAADFPADDTGYGFDNIADVLTTSPLLVEKYLAAAEQALEQALGDNRPAPPAVVKILPGHMRGDGRGVPRVLSTEGEVFAMIPVAQGKWTLRFLASADQGGDEPTRMSVRIDGREVESFDVEARQAAPKAYEVTAELPRGSRRIAAAFVNDYYDPSAPRGKRDRNLAIHALEIVGPLDKAEPLAPPDTRDAILFVKASAGGLTEEQAAAKVLERFATRAYRRPMSGEEVSRLVAVFKSARAEGDEELEAMKVALSAVLVSPNFLFRIEQERSDDPSKPYFIGDHELASRLSYFLWSSLPDDELAAAASSGKVRELITLQSQIKRMLADRKSSEFVTNFVGQWLVMRNLEHHSVDRGRYEEFDERLRADMLREVELFFANVIKEDRSVLELLDCDYTFVNERLARLYGIKDVQGGDFRRVSLSGTPRGGVLTMAGVLTVTAMPTRTSPVKRGKFVLEQLLAAPPPPPPPDAPSLPERRGDSRRQSLRQRLEAHRTDSSCIACHARMDPIGFALENFDGIGRWRDDDRGNAIDASGSLPEGDTFNGPVELRKVLVARKDEFVQCLVEKMLTYALGRGLEEYDRCTVKDIAEQVARDGYRFSALVNAIVRSDAFQKRRARRAGE